MNAVDRLIEKTLEKKNSAVIGLDPDIEKIPACYKAVKNQDSPFAAVAEAILNFNIDVIDSVAPLVPAIKPQMAFYEKYGSWGVRAFEKTVAYAKDKGLVVIEDAKRNDIGNTARAYADGHLGEVALLDGTTEPSFDADFLTVTPYLGSESLQPFVDNCVRYEKGIFVLVKTSNSSAGELQDAVAASGRTVSLSVADFVAEKAELCVGDYGYSSIGAVVGATYPEAAAVLRKAMPKSYFLVPGYGAQGGRADDVLLSFNQDGLGAVVNSSRGILYSHMSDSQRQICTRAEYIENVRAATATMRADIYDALKNYCSHMKY